MNDTSANLSDPEEQLRAIDRMMDLSSAKIKQLKSTIETFTTKFSSHEKELTTLYKETKAQQDIFKEIIEIRTFLNKIIDKLNTNQRLKPALSVSLEQNFDSFMAAMREAVDAKNYLTYQLYFKDAEIERERLTETIKSCTDVILKYFKDLAQRSATPIPLDYFEYDQNGKFIITVKEYSDDILYPISKDILNRMNAMASILDQLDHKEQIQIYSSEHLKQMTDSLKPILETSKVKPPLSSSMNILDLPRYKPRTHPIHIFCNTICFFLKRELKFARTVFGDKYKKPFSESVNTIFNKNLTASINALVSPIHSHVDILFFLDVVRTISQSMEEVLGEEAFGNFAQTFLQLQHAFYEPIVICLTKYKEAVETHDKDEVPPSGGVTAVASNVIIFLGSLVEYHTCIPQIIRSTLDAYANEVLSGLLQNLLEKSKHYTDIVLRSLFLMNNAHYMYTAIEGNEALKAYVKPEFIQQLEDLIQNSQKDYMNETWNKAFAILSYDSAFDGYKKQMPLNNTQKKIIKQKFSNFNAAILSLQTKHCSYCLKNKKLMAPIMNEAISKTKSKFESFYQKWHDSGFSKNPEKYTQTQPSTVEGIITRLYGGQKTEQPK